MAIPVVVITNVSNQSIKVLHEAGDPTNAAGDVAAQASGMLEIPPGRRVTIEQQRLDLGQLENLESKNLIQTTRTLE